MRYAAALILALVTACGGEPPIIDTETTFTPTPEQVVVTQPQVEDPPPPQPVPPAPDPLGDAVAAARRFRPPDPSCSLADVFVEGGRITVQWHSEAYTNFSIGQPGAKLCPSSTDPAWNAFPSGLAITAELLVGPQRTFVDRAECWTRQPPARDSTSHAAQVVGFSRSQICKAGIGKTMGRDPAIMRTRPSGGFTVVSYVRDDGELWTYRCRIQGDRIVWASETGRWRTHPADEVLTFAETPDGNLRVDERYSDGSGSSKIYSAAELGF